MEDRSQHAGATPQVAHYNQLEVLGHAGYQSQMEVLGHAAATLHLGLAAAAADMPDDFHPLPRPVPHHPAYEIVVDETPALPSVSASASRSRNMSASGSLSAALPEPFSSPALGNKHP